MKSTVPTKDPVRVIVSLAGLLMLVLFAGRMSLAAEGVPQKTDSSNTPSSVPSVPRDLPFQTIYNAKAEMVEAVADSLEYNKEAGKMIARGNAVITYQKTKLLADYAEVETDTKKVYAKGHVIVYEGTSPRLLGEEVYYDFENRTGSFPNARAISGPWFCSGKDIRQVRDGVDKITDGHVTTCSLDKPHYEIRCKKATLQTNVKLQMYSATIYVLGKPVFWLPYISIPLNWPEVPFQISPGYKRQFGAYIELSKGIAINKYLYARIRLDWREKKGFGVGWDQYYNFGRYAQGNVRLYLARDQHAPTPNHLDSLGNLDPYAQTEARDRGRITWRHRSDFDDGTTILLRYNRQSDAYFLQDFFEKEHRADIEQHSFVTVTHNTENYGIMFHAEKRMNSYESLVEKLPEVRLDWKNQPFMGDRLYNESRIQYDNMTILQNGNPGHQDAMRTDAYTQWYYPLKWDEIKFTPFAGYRGTEYSQQLSTESPIYRNIIDYGADLRTQFYKTHDVVFDKFGVEVNQLRHIIEPSVRFDGAYSTVAKTQLARFDTTDALDSAQNITLGLENRLQTKRMVNGTMKRVDLVSLNTFLLYEGTPANPAVQGSRFSTAGVEFVLRPYEWLQYKVHSEYDFQQHYLRVSNQDIMIKRGNWRFLLGQRFTHKQYDWYEEQWIQPSQQYVFDTRYRLNPLWEVGGYIRFDSQSTSLKEWQVSATRDLHDFILEFGYSARNSLIATNNNQLFFNFRMKGFPAYQLREGGRATFSEPRIGETVAGANENPTGPLAGASDNQLISLQP